jgi:hypothetical protein
MESFRQRLRNVGSEEFLQVADKIIVASPVPPPPMSRLELLLEHRVLGKVAAILTICGVLFILGNALLTPPTVLADGTVIARMEPVMAALLGGLAGAATGFVFQVGK